MVCSAVKDYEDAECTCSDAGRTIRLIPLWISNTAAVADIANLEDLKKRQSFRRCVFKTKTFTRTFKLSAFDVNLHFFVPINFFTIWPTVFSDLIAFRLESLQAAKSRRLQGIFQAAKPHTQAANPLSSCEEHLRSMFCVCFSLLHFLCSSFQTNLKHPLLHNLSTHFFCWNASFVKSLSSNDNSKAIRLRSGSCLRLESESSFLLQSRHSRCTSRHASLLATKQ